MLAADEVVVTCAHQNGMDFGLGLVASVSGLDVATAKAGMVIWGRRRVDAHLPALQSRVASTPKAEPVVVTPAAPPAPDKAPV